MNSGVHANTCKLTVVARELHSTNEGHKSDISQHWLIFQTVLLLHFRYLFFSIHLCSLVQWHDSLTDMWPWQTPKYDIDLSTTLTKIFIWPLQTPSYDLDNIDLPTTLTHSWQLGHLLFPYITFGVRIISCACFVCIWADGSSKCFTCFSKMDMNLVKTNDQ